MSARGPISPTEPAVDAAAVSPNDSTDLPDGTCRALYVGTLGDVKVTTRNGSDVTFVGVSGLLQVQCKRVWSTGTTADDIVALY